MPHRIALALTVAALVWAAMLVAAPVAVKGTALTVPAGFIYAQSARICHQRSERSFHIGGIPLPVCARCFGLYLSGAVGALLAWGSRRRAGEDTRRALAVAAVPTAVTWGLEMAGLAAFSNLSRAMAALPLGVVAGWVFVQLLRYDSSLDAHEVHDSRSHVRGR